MTRNSEEALREHRLKHQAAGKCAADTYKNDPRDWCQGAVTHYRDGFGYCGADGHDLRMPVERERDRYRALLETFRAELSRSSHQWEKEWLAQIVAVLAKGGDK